MLKMFNSQNKIPVNCEYCKRSRKVENQLKCTAKLTPASDLTRCRFFEYDPLKRNPSDKKEKKVYIPDDDDI